METIEDLSYSNIVTLIQHDQKKAGKVLKDIALQMEANAKEIEHLERSFIAAKGKRLSLIDASKHVLKHIKKDSPLAVECGGYIVVVSDKTISIERNVIKLE